MDSFTVNKIAGAFLGTCLAGMGIGIVAQGIFAPEAPKKPGYALPEPKEGAGGSAKPAEVPLPVLLSKADPKKGEKDVQVCSACHNLNEGGGTKIGPDLYGVVDRPKGSVAGFDYSAGMKGKGGKWTFEDLNTFLTKPSAYVSGTKMGYPGEESPEKRADILAYLASNAKPPVPLPKVTEADKKMAEGGGAAAPAGGGEAKGGDDVVAMIATADPKAGEKDSQVCGACHNLKEGGGVLVGPPLWGVVDRDKGSVAGFDYSAGLKAKGGKWTYADLDAWLKKPAAYIPGTKMGYPGEENPKKRAAIIAYLRTLAKTPAPLPKAGEAKAGGEEKKAESMPAEGGKGAAPAGGGFAKLVASADAKKGEKDAQVCGACHNLKEGGGVLVGPPLWGIVDKAKASFPGFDYSAGLKGKGGKWTYDDLNEWLTSPAKYAPGTKMGYPGEANEKKRAEIVAFLRSLAKTPAPLPGAGGDAAAPPAPAADKAPPAGAQPPAAPKAPEAAAPAPKPDVAAPPPPAPKPDAAPSAPPPPEAKPEQKTEAAPYPPGAGKPNESAAAGPQPYDAVDPVSASQPPASASKTFESAPSKVDLGDAGGATETAPQPYSAPDPDEAGKT